MITFTVSLLFSAFSQFKCFVMETVYLATGSNQGNSLQILHQAVQAIEQQGAGSLTAASSLYRTAAWGLHQQPDFLNQVLRIETALAPAALLQQLLAIEHSMGRLRTQKNGPRTLDLDILFYGEAIIHLPQLVVPHPLLHERRFVLVPLQEIAPALLHPVLHKTITQLLDECADPLHVNKF